MPVRLLVTSRAGSRNGAVIHPDLAPLGSDMTILTMFTTLDVLLRLFMTTGTSGRDGAMIHMNRLPI